MLHAQLSVCVRSTVCLCLQPCVVSEVSRVQWSFISLAVLCFRDLQSVSVGISGVQCSVMHFCRWWHLRDSGGSFAQLYEKMIQEDNVVVVFFLLSLYSVFLKKKMGMKVTLI